MFSQSLYESYLNWCMAVLCRVYGSSGCNTIEWWQNHLITLAKAKYSSETNQTFKSIILYQSKLIDIVEVSKSSARRETFFSLLVTLIHLVNNFLVEFSPHEMWDALVYRQTNINSNYFSKTNHHSIGCIFPIW